MKVMIKQRWIMSVCLMIGVVKAHAQDTVRYTLAQCMQMALEKNLTIQKGQVNLQRSELDLRQSKMDRLPDLNAGGSYGINWGRSIDPTSNQFITRSNPSANLNASSNLTLYQGGRVHNTIKRNQANYAANEQDFEKAKNDVMLSVMTLYLNVLLNEALLANANYQYATTVEQLKRMQKLVDAGALPITKLLDLQAQVASSELSVVKAKNTYTLALLNLKQTLLIPAFDPFAIVTPEVEISEREATLRADDIYETAKATMPEVKSAEWKIRAAALNYKISRGAYTPRLSTSFSLSTNYSNVADRPRQIYDGTTTTTLPIGYVGGTNEQVLTSREVPNVVDVRSGFGFFDQFKENISRNLAFRLSIPIFNKFKTRAGVQRALFNKYTSEISLQEVKNQLRQRIETAYNDRKSAYYTHQASLKQVKALQEAFRIMESQYQLGAVNFVDYQVASNNLYRAKSDLVRAKFDFVFKQKVLDFYSRKPLTF